MKELKRKLKKYLGILHIWYKNYTAYIYDLIWVNITYVLRLTVIIFFYKAIYLTSSTGIIEWYSIQEMIRALIFVQAIVVSKPRITDEIGTDIKSGKIWVFLLNPISYIGFKFFEHMPRFLYNLWVSLSIWLLVGLSFIWSIDTNMRWILWGTVLLLGWMLVAFFGYMMVWLLWFYSEDTESYRLLYSKLDLFFGWNILPLAFMPAFIQAIAFASPFAYAGYTAWLLFVKFDMHKFFNYLSMQAIRIVIFISVCTLIYKHGKTKVTINGW